MMTHIPSFLVGSVVSGSSFLLIHRELSHRERLSSRWVLAELVQEEVDKIRNQAKSKMNPHQKPEVPDISKYVHSAIHTWNDSISQVKHFFSRK